MAVVQDPDPESTENPDCHQNLTTSFFGVAQPLHEILAEIFCDFSRLSCTQHITHFIRSN